MRVIEVYGFIFARRQSNVSACSKHLFLLHSGLEGEAFKLSNYMLGVDSTTLEIDWGFYSILLVLLHFTRFTPFYSFYSILLVLLILRAHIPRTLRQF
jgi:hypothetical protein